MPSVENWLSHCLLLHTISVSQSFKLGYKVHMSWKLLVKASFLVRKRNPLLHCEVTACLVNVMTVKVSG